MELSLNRGLPGNSIGGQMKSSIPWGRVEHLFSVAELALDSLYEWDILSSICNTKQLCARSERSDHAHHCRLSIFSLGSISTWHLAVFQRHSKTVQMFSSLLLTATSNQNSVYFSKAASTVSHTCNGVVGVTTFQPRYALITVSQMESKFDCLYAVPLHIF